jgi:predicted DNA-binding transcriptional regulator AlpA
MIENNEGWMTGAEVGRMLRLAPGTLNNWRSAGRGPKYVKLAGGVVRYPEADVKAWMDAQRLGRAA